MSSSKSSLANTSTLLSSSFMQNLNYDIDLELLEIEEEKNKFELLFEEKLLSVSIEIQSAEEHPKSQHNLHINKHKLRKHMKNSMNRRRRVVAVTQQSDNRFNDGFSDFKSDYYYRQYCTESEEQINSGDTFTKNWPIPNSIGSPIIWTSENEICSNKFNNNNNNNNNININNIINNTKTEMDQPDPNKACQAQQQQQQHKQQ